MLPKTTMIKLGGMDASSFAVHPPVIKRGWLGNPRTMDLNGPFMAFQWETKSISRFYWLIPMRFSSQPWPFWLRPGWPLHSKGQQPPAKKKINKSLNWIENHAKISRNAGFMQNHCNNHFTCASMTKNLRHVGHGNGFVGRLYLGLQHRAFVDQS